MIVNIGVYVHHAAMVTWQNFGSKYWRLQGHKVTTYARKCA